MKKQWTRDAMRAELRRLAARAVGNGWDVTTRTRPREIRFEARDPRDPHYSLTCCWAASANDETWERDYLFATEKVAVAHGLVRVGVDEMNDVLGREPRGDASPVVIL